MKTKPMKHQEIGCALLRDNPISYALAAEQGTGKTWMLLADAEWQFQNGDITAMLVIAPKGVHTNWTRREIPKHMSIPVQAAHYSSGMGIRRMKKVTELNKLPPDRLAVLSINIDAINTEKGYSVVAGFLKAHYAMAVLDESTRIKNPKAKRTQKAIKLAALAKSRRIASGTMIAHSPLDAFAQFEFLGNGLLGTTSFRAFTARHAVLYPSDHRLVQEAKAKSRWKGADPQIIVRDVCGRPKFRNLEMLAEFMSPYTYRVLKEDCMDLPEKVYQTYGFELSPAQMKVYETIKEEMLYEHHNGEIDRFNALTKLNKLRQVTSGFIMVDSEATELGADNPRMKLLMDVIQDVEGQFIIWAVYREEIRQIAAMLEEAGITVVQYHGGVKEKDREAAIDNFDSGAARVFLGNPQAGGTGLTLANATTAIYYSNDFSTENRLQSEDRNHRYGAKGGLYIDLVAEGTIDERIAQMLQFRKEISMEIYEEL